MKLYFVTSNRHKFLEVKELLEGIVELEQAPIELVEIQANTLEEIAEFKVRDAYRKLKAPVVVEDSGLFIEALKGFPGPYSSYVLKTIGNEGILKLLKGIDNRRAYFKAVVAYYDGRTLKLFEGIVYGIISDRIRGEKGFGFDPIFIPEGYAKTFAEDYELKKRLSHRYKAFVALKEWLAEYLKIEKLR